MIRVILICCVFLLSTPLKAQNIEEDSKNMPRIKVDKKQEQHPESQPKKNPPSWPIPFQPSKEIGADSQVSFPTDI